MTRLVATPAAIAAIARSAAANVYLLDQHSASYQETVARMLCAVAAMESGLEERRQRAMPWYTDVGAFSLWQVEGGSVADSIAFLKKHPDLFSRATEWLWETKAAENRWTDVMGIRGITWAMRGWDRIGCLFARLHLLRQAGPIPPDLDSQFTYWLNRYNGQGVLKHATPAAALAQWRARWDSLFADYFAAHTNV